MTTVLQIINGATEEIGVKTAETPLEASDYQFTLDRMNDMLTEWADMGLTPAFKEVFNSTDTVDVERNAVAAIKYALGVRIAPAFMRPVSPALAKNAADSLQRLEASASYIGEVAYPDSLPLGSGNECNDSYGRRFFNQNKVENF